ncbi:MAG: hypothetical protein ACJ75B_02310 [Flavisolibacter sp.]
MNLFKRLAQLAYIRLSFSSLLSTKQTKAGISRKEWVDFALVLGISFLIIVYKVNKAS